MATDIRSARRMSAIQLVLAAAVGLVGNALHPHTADADIAATLEAIGGNTAWVGIHLAIITAILLLAAGALGIISDADRLPTAPMAGLARAVMLVGAALVCTSTAIDGFAMKPLASAWSASRADALLPVASGVKAIDFGIWSLGMLVFFGAAFILTGATVRAARLQPPILGWAAIASGIGSSVAALLQIANTGELQAAETIFLASSLLITVWAFVTGLVLWRSEVRASAPARTPADARG